MSDFSEIDIRARQVFQRLVETYIATGEPVGSRTLSQDTAIDASAATVRNVMADLTDLGLLHAPHISAGRLPTELGLRLFVDSLLQVGDLSDQERARIDGHLQGEHDPANLASSVLENVAAKLSGLTQTASLVLTEKVEAPLRHLEFVSTGPGKALAVLVFDDGNVENRVIDIPTGMPPASLITAGNYLNARLRGQTLGEARAHILNDLETNRAALDTLTAQLVRDGVATVTGTDETDTKAASLIVRGRGRLLDEHAADNLERVRMLFDDLERKQEMIDLLSAAREGDGVRIFIGSENRLFSLSGSSVVVAPYRDSKDNIVGVLGVIGPTRLNYARVIPIVDYTADLVSRLLK
ncbi:MAG: heat-inducible transcriptional repressor HrcA [Pseudomonadota bacterium]